MEFLFWLKKSWRNLLIVIVACTMSGFALGIFVAKKDTAPPIPIEHTRLTDVSPLPGECRNMGSFGPAETPHGQFFINPVYRNSSLPIFDLPRFMSRRYLPQYAALASLTGMKVYTVMSNHNELGPDPGDAYTTDMFLVVPSEALHFLTLRPCEVADWAKPEFAEDPIYTRYPGKSTRWVQDEEKIMLAPSNIPFYNQPHNITGPGVLKCCVVEIRSYNLVPNKRPEFHQLIIEEALPLVDRWETDLVAYGRWRHDKDSYYVIRAYKSLTDREESQQTFYASSEWRDGPREKILSMIENYTTVVLNMDRATIDAIRANFEKTGERNPD